MRERLRQRRDALRAELNAIEHELADSRAPSLSAELRDALQTSSEFVTLIDTEGRVVHNSRHQPEAPETAGHSVYEFIAEPYHPILRATIERAHRLGHPCPCRVDGRGARGAAYHLWAVPLPEPVAGATTTLIGFEATHLQQLERALQDPNSAVHSLLKGIPDTILLVDRDRHVTFANAVRRAKPEDLFGVDVATLAPESARDGVRRAIDFVFEGGGSTAYETHVDLPAGRFWYFTRIGPIERDGVVVRACLVSTEITEQRERELQLQKEREALKASEARFRVLVEHAPEALVIYDVETQLFVDASESACALFLVDRAGLIERGPIELSPYRQPDGRTSEEAGSAYIQRALAEGSADFEWVHTDARGREFVCEVHLVSLPYGERRLIRGSIFDITDRKRVEEERERLQRELFQAQKIQAIGHLTGGVAHDFNNLLTVIMSHAELLEMDAGSAAKVTEHAKQIVAASMRAAALTQQLLAFGRRQPLKPHRIDLAELVARMQQLLTRTLGETIVVRTEYTEPLSPCIADRTQLENAILNLAINARDAMPNGGTLTISMEDRHVRAGGRDARIPPGYFVVVTVADNGSGMSPDVMASAFEPFFTTKEVGRGSGLGLSMVYGFVKQSGGHVELDSEPNRGTRVALYLPAADGDALEAEPEVRPREQRGQRELILVVEDEHAVRATTVQALQHLGYRTVDAAEASDGLAALEQNPGIALVLTDVVLTGGISGVKLARRIAERHPELPVVFMSGHAADVVARDGELPGTAPLLEKPFTRHELGGAIRAALDRAASK
jgi:PAS domain S-box-containing protein